MARTIFTVEVQVYDPSIPGTTTKYYATEGFTTTPSDTPASTHFDARVKQPCQISRTMFAPNTTRGRSTVGIGDIVLLNGDSGLDSFGSWGTNVYGVDGRTVRVRRGTLGAAYPSGFQTIFLGTMQGVEVTQDYVYLKLRDNLAELNVPLQTTKYTGAGLGTLEGTSDTLQGKPKPVCYGKVLNVAPPCVEPAKLIYQVSDGTVVDIPNAYDRGVALRPQYGAYLMGVLGNGNLRSSSDSGDNWSDLTGHGIAAPRGAAWGRGVWVVGNTSGTNVLYRSTDGGATWSVALTAASNPNPRRVRYLNGNFVVPCTDCIYFSSDLGVTWTRVNINDTTFSRVFEDVGYGVDRYVLVETGTVRWSLDLLNWTSVTVSGTWRGIAYDPTNALFIIVGGTGTPVISTSPDGIGWTSRTVPASHTAFRYNSVSVSAAGVAVAVGQTAVVAPYDAIIASASNATTWTARTPPANFTAAAFDVVHDGSYHNIVGNDDLGRVRFARSSDGTTWADASANGTDTNTSVCGIGFGYGGGVVTYANSTDLLNNALAPQAGTFKCLYSSGGSYFRLGASPDGLVTADVTQGTADANRTTGQLWATILDERGGQASGDWSASDVTALDTANNDVIGFWTDQEARVADVIDMVKDSAGAASFIDASGVFRIKQFLAPTGSPVLSLTANDLLRPLVRKLPSEPGQGIPPYRHILRYQKNYTPQTTDVAASVTDARKAFLAKQWREVTDTDVGVQTKHPLAIEIVEETLLDSASDAATEADRRQTMRGTDRSMFELVLELNDDTDGLELNDVVEITHDRYGLSGGELFRIIGLNLDAAARTLTVTVWG